MVIYSLFSLNFTQDKTIYYYKSSYKDRGRKGKYRNINNICKGNLILKKNSTYIQVSVTIKIKKFEN